jgi:Flavin-binding monooxygenase-like
VKFLVTAVGCLSTANVPEIPGLHDFKGARYHTGHRPHEGVDFTGKRVGMIGTGSTGIQAAPVIAAQARHLTVFQRTANCSVPARNVSVAIEQTPIGSQIASSTCARTCSNASRRGPKQSRSGGAGSRSRQPDVAARGEVFLISRRFPTNVPVAK